jgi:LysR family carnitine catabolism transcriptional activator
MPAWKPTLRQLEAFARVARLGSFARAAAELGLSPPALSQAISQLELGLGTTLIHRTTRSAHLTVDGEFLLPTAERVQSELDGALVSLKEGALTRRSRIAIGAVPSLAVGFLPPVMRSFGLRHPTIQVTPNDAPAEQLYRGVEAGQFDIALTSRLPDRPGLTFSPLLQDRFHLVVRRDHPLASAPEVAWRALCDLPVIGFAAGTGTRVALLSELAQAGIDLRPVMELGLSTTILGMVEAGVGVATLTSFALPTAAHPSLTSCLLVEPVIHREIGILTSTQRPLPASAVALREAVRQHAAQVSARQSERSGRSVCDS